MKKTKIIAFGLATVMAVQALPTVAFAAEPSSTSSYSVDESQLVTTFSQADVDSLIPVFEAIEQIPDDLLENGSHAEINQFFQDQGVSLKVYNDAIGETQNVLHIRNKRADGWKCALAIGELLVTVGIPATQITKIKKYIKALGGVKAAAQLLVGATTVSEKLAGTLTALGEVIATISGVSGIKEHCFGR